jgi:hypothetical protein
MEVEFDRNARVVEVRDFKRELHTSETTRIGSKQKCLSVYKRRVSVMEIHCCLYSNRASLESDNDIAASGSELCILMAFKTL